MDMIKATRLVYNYIKRDEEGNLEEENRALDNINLNISEGEFVAILGRNGSGKSTLAKHMNGLLLPSEGTIRIGGMDSADEDMLWKIRQTAGMVFQNPDNQIVGSIVEEDVGFGPENLGVPAEEIWRRVDKSLETVRMTKYRKKSPNRLSGGQKQRVAIAGVMAMRPKCIVLDEPTAMLDPNGRAEVIRTVDELNKKEGITVILITHYMEEAVHADRVVVMNHNHIVLEGAPREVFAQVQTIQECGLDVPQVTELAYRLKQRGLDLPDGILTIQELTEELTRIYQGDKREEDPWQFDWSM